MSHLQIVFVSTLVYQYPTSSPCWHLPWTISTPETSQNAFCRETAECKLYWVPCCVGGLLLWCTLSQFWVICGEISVVSEFILSALLFTIHLHVSW